MLETKWPANAPGATLAELAAFAPLRVMLCRRARSLAVGIQPLARIPGHGHRADSLEPDSRIVRLDEREQPASGEQKPARSRLDAVENRLRELWLRLREDVVAAKDDDQSAIVRHLELGETIHPRHE